MKATASELAKSENAELSAAARFHLIAVQLQTLDPNDVPGAAALVQEVDKYLADGPLSNNHLSVATSLAQRLEQFGHTELAATAYETFAARLVASDLEQAANIGAQMQGAVRRLNLVGNPIEFEGTLVDGSELDWAKYRGKVVLIDFWATWCGPCVQELPNVLANYEKYHDRGFEVVGISLDEDRGELEAFLKDHKIPWATIFSDNPTGGGNMLATYYNVATIPNVWLVDQDGKVVSLMARGPALGEMLAELLGDPAAEKGDATKKDVAEGDKS
jgi:thiol-disulfide isomerase/thioredoxin